MATSGIIQIVRCKVCSLVENKDKIVRCKWGTLTKHVNQRIIVHDLPQFGVKEGGEYIAKDCAHLKNMWLWAQRGPNFVLQQIKKPLGKGNQKILQFKSLFHIFSHGCPKLEYETMYDLFTTLKVPINPKMHWSDFVG
jgi:hypothetical protein